MKKYRAINIIIFSVIISGICFSQESMDYGKYFDEYNVKGSFLLYDLKKDKYYYYDSSRCNTRFTPASTFKIPNSIIGLETGVIPDENFVIKWDGVKRNFKGWNRDLDMKTAIEVSAVPYYQELARRVGENKMKEMVALLGYGNMDITGGIDKFWLDGSLRISQFEQIAFLKRLYNDELPVSSRSMEITKKIIPGEDTMGLKFKGKTGWGEQDNKVIGWWVGWIQKDNDVYFFATNIESDNPDDRFAAARKTITKNIIFEYLNK